MVYVLFQFSDFAQPATMILRLDYKSTMILRHHLERIPFTWEPDKHWRMPRHTPKHRRLLFLISHKTCRMGFVLKCTSRRINGKVHTNKKMITWVKRFVHFLEAERVNYYDRCKRLKRSLKTNPEHFSVKTHTLKCTPWIICHEKSLRFLKAPENILTKCLMATS